MAASASMPHQDSDSLTFCIADHGRNSNTETMNAAALNVQFRRTSLTVFPAQSIRSSNAIALDTPYLLVLITDTSESRQHDKSESDKSSKAPTAELFDADSGRISIHHGTTTQSNGNVPWVFPPVLVLDYVTNIPNLQPAL
ncbi:hypothetical protein Tco_0676665 [Tanacetum coccineum]